MSLRQTLFVFIIPSLYPLYPLYPFSAKEYLFSILSFMMVCKKRDTRVMSINIFGNKQEIRDTGYGVFSFKIHDTGSFLLRYEIQDFRVDFSSFFLKKRVEKRRDTTQFFYSDTYVVSLVSLLCIPFWSFKPLPKSFKTRDTKYFAFCGKDTKRYEKGIRGGTIVHVKKPLVFLIFKGIQSKLFSILF